MAVAIQIFIKRGFIPAELPPIIIEFGINPDKWIEHVKNFSRRYASCAGSRDNIVNFAEFFGRAGGKGKGVAAEVYV